jgi:Asp-tRNA(Asn)/Glu-tRNA(Gln) amidotransferase A subunit family amidase
VHVGGDCQQVSVLNGASRKLLTGFSIIGTTSNPFNRSFSCGGSSGGEGALIGFHASRMGIGSDLGGSIRR